MKKWSLAALLMMSSVVVGCTGDGPGVAATTWPNPPASERSSAITSSTSSIATTPLMPISTLPSQDLATITPPSEQELPLGTSSTHPLSEDYSLSESWPPSDFTGEQVAWSAEAWDAWRKYDDMTRRAYENPGGDWAAQLSTVVMGQRLDDTVRGIVGMSQNGVIQTGFVEYSLVEVVSALSDRVEMNLCADSSGVEAFYADGSQVDVDRSVPRSLMQIVVVRDSDGLTPWILAEYRPLGVSC